MTADTRLKATAPEDRVPIWQMIVYGLGGFTNNLLAGCIGAMMIVLNLGLGMDPALVGLLAAIPRFFDAFTDPIVGYISDKTRSRWGRRRPFIFIGAILVGLVYIMLWQLPEGQSETFYFWYFLIGSLAFYLAYTLFATPWVALGYEMTPDYFERSKLMGVQNFISQFAFFIPPWLLFFMEHERLFDNLMDGAAGVGLLIGLIVMSVGVLPAIFIRERHVETGEENTHSSSLLSTLTDFLTGFAKTITFIPFLKLCIVTFLVFNGFILIAAFQSYVMIYYVFGGDRDAASLYIGYIGTIGTAANFLIIIFAAWLSLQIGKKRALALCISVSALGHALKWFCYSIDEPSLILLTAPLISFGFGGLFTIIPAMMADVVDFDELKTGERREGMYGSIFWWVVKLGQTVALAGGGFLLNASGFDVNLEGAQTTETLYWLRVYDVITPVITSLLAVLVLLSFKISPAKAQAIRTQLEEKRAGAAGQNQTPAIA